MPDGKIMPATTRAAILWSVTLSLGLHAGVLALAHSLGTDAGTSNPRSFEVAVVFADAPASSEPAAPAVVAETRHVPELAPSPAPRSVVLPRPPRARPPASAPRPAEIGPEPLAPAALAASMEDGGGEAAPPPHTFLNTPNHAPSPASGWDIVLRVPPRYPVAARRQGIEGRVVVLAHIDDDGQAQRVWIERSSGDNHLDSAARSAVERWRFRTDRPRTVEIPIVFRLQQHSDESGKRSAAAQIARP